MAALTGLDMMLVLAYFASIIIIGYITSKKETDEGYLIADRNLGSWSTMATVNASKTGSILMIFTAMVYVYGFAAIWYFLGMSLGVLLFIPFALRLKADSCHRYYTMADYFRHRYGKAVAFFPSVVTIFLMVGYLVLNLMAGSKIFMFFTGWPFWLCSVIMIVVVLAYLLMGGFRAVVQTDMLQYAAMVTILGLMVFLLGKGATVPASEWNLWNANIKTIIGFFVIGILYPFGVSDIWQRVFAAKDKKSLRNGLLLSVLVYVGFAFLLGIIALTIKARFPDIDHDLALIHGFSQLLPKGLVGLALVLLFAAIMSSIDTYMFTGASAVVQDFFRLGKRETVIKMRQTMVIIGIIATIISILIQDLLVSAYLFVSFVVVLASATIATWIRRRIRPLTLKCGYVVGIVSVISLLIYYLAAKGEIQPTLIIIALLLTIAGMLAGGAISWFLHKPAHKTI